MPCSRSDRNPSSPTPFTRSGQVPPHPCSALVARYLRRCRHTRLYCRTLSLRSKDPVDWHRTTSAIARQPPIRPNSRHPWPPSLRTVWRRPAPSHLRRPYGCKARLTGRPQHFATQLASQSSYMTYRHPPYPSSLRLRLRPPHPVEGRCHRLQFGLDHQPLHNRSRAISSDLPISVEHGTPLCLSSLTYDMFLISHYAHIGTISKTMKRGG